MPGGLNESGGKFSHINDRVIVVFDISLPRCRILVVIQGIPVSEEVPVLHPERNILRILW